MSGVRVLVGTRKGAFVLTSDGKTRTTGTSAVRTSQAGRSTTSRARRPIRTGIYASQSTSWFGQLIQRSDDGGTTWEPVGNEFAYDGVPGTHQWYDGTPAPVGVRAGVAPRAVADRPRHRLRRRRRRRAVPDRPTAARAGTSSPACAATARGRRGSPAPAGCACTRSSSTRAIPSASSSRSRRRARSARDDGGKTWRPINRGLHSEEIPDGTPRSATACTASRCTRRVRRCSSCRSTGTSCAPTTPASRGGR